MGTKEESPDGPIPPGLLIEALHQENLFPIELDDPRLWDGDPTFASETQKGRLTTGRRPRR